VPSPVRRFRRFDHRLPAACLNCGPVTIATAVGTMCPPSRGDRNDGTATLVGGLPIASRDQQARPRMAIRRPSAPLNEEDRLRARHRRRRAQMLGHSIPFTAAAGSDVFTNAVDALIFQPTRRRRRARVHAASVGPIETRPVACNTIALPSMYSARRYSHLDSGRYHRPDEAVTPAFVPPGSRQRTEVSR